MKQLSSQQWMDGGCNLFICAKLILQVSNMVMVTVLRTFCKLLWGRKSGIYITLAAALFPGSIQLIVYDL